MGGIGGTEWSKEWRGNRKMGTKWVGIGRIKWADMRELSLKKGVEECSGLGWNKIGTF